MDLFKSKHCNILFQIYVFLQNLNYCALEKLCKTRPPLFFFLIKENMNNINIFFTIFCLDQRTEIRALCACVCVCAYAMLNYTKIIKRSSFEKEDNKSRSS